MAVEVVMPKMGWTMEFGTLVEWRRKDGEAVHAGDVIFTVESDKALAEVEALEGGILRIPPGSPPPGERVAVGGVLAYLVQPGEPTPFESGAHSTAATVGDRTVAAPQPTLAHAPEGLAPRRSREGASAASPRARRVAAELGLDWSAFKGSGRTGRIVERDVMRAAARMAPQAETRVTPLARRLAEQAGVDLEQLANRISGRRITHEDVEAAVWQQAASVARPTVPQTGRLEREPLSTMRRVVRDRMVEATRTAAAVTLMSEADASELVALRARLASIAQDSDRLRAPTYNDLFVRLVACALLDHPDLNSSLDGDTLILHPDVHIGLAVDIARGLLVPVVRDAHRKGIWEIAEESARLIDQASSGSIAPEDLRGGTFTITNLGGLEVDAFTPILNLPESAILGVGKIALRPVVDVSGERIVPRHTVTLSLTFDHRVVDGAPAARFLKRIRQYVEEPLLWLAR